MSVRIILVIVFLVEIAAGQLCKSPADFKDYCTSQYNGTAVGGHCFFLAQNPDKSSLRSAQWTGAFDTCKGQGDGAALAQIYSEGEMSAIWTKYKPIMLTPMITNWYLWISLRNLATVAAIPNTTHVIYTDTHWYNDASTITDKITANNTFLRYRVSDDPRPGDGECFVLFPYDNEIRIGDIFCDVPDPRFALLTLCIIQNVKQDFTLTPSGCFMEKAVVTETALCVNQCATLCARQTWCRTFNYHEQAQLCDLFALHADDAGASVSKRGIADCYMYTADA